MIKKNACQIKNKLRRKGEKRRKDYPHTGESTILRLPFSQGSPTSHQSHAGDQAFATWAFGRHSGCNPQLSLAADSIHTASSPLKYWGSRVAQGTCARLKLSLIFRFVDSPKRRKSLVGKRVNWDIRSKLETWGPQSRKVDQGLSDFRGWKLLKLRARNPDHNS